MTPPFIPKLDSPEDTKYFLNAIQKVVVTVYIYMMDLIHRVRLFIMEAILISEVILRKH